MVLAPIGIFQNGKSSTIVKNSKANVLLLWFPYRLQCLHCHFLDFAINFARLVFAIRKPSGFEISEISRYSDKNDLVIHILRRDLFFAAEVAFSRIKSNSSVHLHFIVS